MGSQLKITWTRSAIGSPKDQKDTIKALGLHKLQSWVVKEDTPSIRGMINKVKHLVSVEEVTA